ncbi:nitric oxide synthase oxygenase [Deinococcus reticulitermitis]|uniref:nitric oxide synthase oxygenase n=1 Tax=Deinococcus reticulitermitis TaxID=856736 RepID=UPI000B89A178
MHEAEEFLRAFHAEEGLPGLAGRLREVAQAGAYWPTAAELAYGARVAWRHSARCVGRLYWPSLEVRDLRGVRELDGVYSQLLAHLRDAFHGGQVRALISVFGPEVRIHNPQLIRYADDPLCAPFVEALRREGWRPSGERFEVLPLLLEVRGERRVYALPRSAVQEVKLTHPECAAFAGLGLRWHALPVISDLDLSLGGTRWPCAFSGWYVQTEIAARNLADPQRYDQLPAVARALGLDTSRERTLWRDRALVELNVAVLHSFDAAGVKIADHHSVTRHHLRFEEREARAGRAVRGQWSWLIPPLSPATTPIWGRRYRAGKGGPTFAPRDPAPLPAAACPPTTCPFTAGERRTSAPRTQEAQGSVTPR